MTAAATAMMCPITWSLDSPGFPLQEMVLTVSWSLPPTSSTTPPFTPNCRLIINTSNGLNGGSFILNQFTVSGGGTATPMFTYSWNSVGTGPLVFYQSVIGSVLSCAAVPPGVVLNGYSLTTCVASVISNC